MTWMPSIPAMACVLCSASAILRGTSIEAESHDGEFLFKVAAGGVLPGMASRTTHAKVDIFLDLACPGSAAAWPTIKDIVGDFSSKADFTFHMFPLTKNKKTYDAAKVVHVISANSGGSSEVLLFIDRVFTDQQFLFADGEDDASAVEQILANWAISGGELSIDQLESGMDDPMFDDYMENGLRSGTNLGVLQTPTVILDNSMILFLAGTAELQHLRMFIEVGTDAISSGFDDYRSSSGSGTTHGTAETMSYDPDYLGQDDAAPYASL